jgi:CPA2 family monovalent cation:H+ antiporter-2
MTEEALLGWSLVQDLVGVSLAALILTIFGTSETPFIMAIGGLIGFAALSVVASKILPIILKSVRWEKDLFLIYSVSFGLVLAAVGTVVFDIPMALAGFIAGLTINQSQDTDEVRKAILPFRDLFAVLFFVVIGTLIQPSLLSQAWPFALLMLVMMVSLKSLPTILIAKLGKMNATPFHLGVGVSQIGEFSFVLGSVAYSQSAITLVQYTGLLLAVVLSITASTILVRRPKVQKQ